MLKYGLLKPMEPRSAKEPFDSPEHIFQVKWDGVRMLAFIAPGQVRLQNRKLNPRTEVYPDFQNLHQFIKAEEAILDGEMIVLVDGKPSFTGVLKRDLKREPLAIEIAAKQIPSTYVAFDLLSLNGENLTGEPLERRLAILREIALPHDHFQVIQDFSDGIALFKAIEAQEMEGIVAKMKSSPYLPGEKSDYWLKIKTKRDIIALVGGFTVKERRLNSLLMGAYVEDKLFYIGNAATGLTSADLRLLEEHLQGLELPRAAFLNPPKLYGVKTHWVQPILTVKIEFLEWSDDFLMRAPIIQGFTKDNPAECRLV